MDKLLARLLYAGLDKTEYDALKEAYTEENRRNLGGYALVAAVFFGALGVIVTLRSGLFYENMAVYFGASAGMAAILIAARLTGRAVAHRTTAVRVLMYLFMAVLYAEGIFVTLGHANMPAVTYIGILLVLPLLFVDRPIHIILAQAFFVAVFCLIVGRYKAPEIASTDIWNGVTFLLASCAEILIITPMKLGLLQKTGQIEFLSRNDLLTGVLNRNAYEQRIKACAGRADSGLVCVYADVNGLHELNNTHGHEAGDRMLRTAAGELKAAFGAEEIYRIGGDEFVVLSAGREPESIPALLEGVAGRLRAEKYAVSFGTAALRECDGNIRETIRTAEQRMYRAKAQYYSAGGRDRRTRRDG